MNRERTINTLLRQLGHCAIRHRPPQSVPRQFSKLARPKNSPLQSALASKLALLPLTQRKNPPAWASARAYSSPSTSQSSTSTPTSPASTSPSRTSTPTTPVFTSTSTPEQPPSERPPSYRIVFTCKPCKNRSTHTITKRGYHYGAVLITCSECKSRHVISDHLGIFTDNKIDIEDLMREKGQSVRRGTLGGHGDFEVWDDGTETGSTKEANKDRST